MSDSSIVTLAIVAIVAITLVTSVALVAVLIYFTEKKILASWKIKAENGKSSVETDMSIETSEQQKS